VTTVECPREQDLLDVLTTDQWPDRCDEELRRHVEACQSCRDLVAVLTPLSEAWAETRSEAHPPGSGMVWWRAQMRARREAARSAARPVAVAQIVGGLVAIAFVAGVLLVVAPWAVQSWTSSQQLIAGNMAGIHELAGGWLFGGGIAAIAITSLAVYLALAED
jgi:hypothetical protein